MEVTTSAAKPSDKVRRKRLNLYKLQPKNFEGKSDVISFNNLSKTYNLAGRDGESVVALK